jgi:hypothetical protein
MAHIVQFHGGPARVVTEPEAAAGDGSAPNRGAQIIIFPGVRRERHAEPEEGPPRQGNGPERDVLELPD